jgi:16S rRNA (cytosine967-C5)-methyltransferase
LGARLLALNVLLDVHLQGAYASLALGERLGRSALAPRDKRLATELTYGALANQIRLDYMIDAYLDRKDVEAVVRDILRLGAYQLFFLDRVPSNAAVDEAVKLTRAKDRESFTGLVNAVLRTMLREPKRVVYPDADAQPALALSVRHSVPLWLAQRLIECYGADVAWQIAAYDPPDQPVTVRANLERITARDFEAYLARRGFQVQPGVVPGAYRIRQPGDLSREAEFRRGLFSIQGESSMLAALAVGARPGWNVLDACAAPGGKTALLAQVLGGSGRVHAWDVHEHRVELLRGMARRLGLDNVRPVLRDAAVPRPEMDATFDAVLVDAPCSGTGVMLSKPDVKYRQTPESVSALVQIQAALLRTCSRYVKPGGTLVYATCSILPEENARQTAAFLAENPAFTWQNIAPALPEPLRPLADGGQVQLLAHRDGLDGFYIARMQRVGGY